MHVTGGIEQKRHRAWQLKEHIVVTSIVGDGLVARTHTSLHAPRASLASCIRAYITRSTMDAPPMSERQRHNHYPAASFCTITWYLNGQAVLVRLGDDEINVPLSAVNFNGPRTMPGVSYNPGRVEMLMLALLPEAVHAFTGIDMTTYVNRSLPFDEVFDSDWRAMAQQVLAAPDHAQRIKLIEDFIEPRWMAARGYRSDGGGMWASRLRDYVSDYIAGMPVRMLASEFGKSLRQIERRIKAQTGLTLQRRLRMLRDEHRFTAARSSMESGASLADIAADSGYADQAHFSRETRRATGMTPNEVKYRAASEESYWVYRIWS